MSTLSVEILPIESVNKYPNADRLDLISIKGWNVVAGKDNYKPGDLIIYIPIDSVLLNEVEKILFPPDSKVKLHNSRVKTIKLRGAISQGMICKPNKLLKNKPTFS